MRRPTPIPSFRCGLCSSLFLTPQEAAGDCEDHPSSMTRHLESASSWVLFGSEHRATARFVEAIITHEGSEGRFTLTPVIEVETDCGITTIVHDDANGGTLPNHPNCSACYPEKSA